MKISFSSVKQMRYNSSKSILGHCLLSTMPLLSFIPGAEATSPSNVLCSCTVLSPKIKFYRTPAKSL